ncbi:hypothetical protein D3C80_1646260 [compost metagenome]
MRIICTLSILLAAMLYCAAATEGLAISVANTRSKLRARASEKLPLPQYSSSRSPFAPWVTFSAHSSICTFMAALGWVKLFSTWR